MALDLEQIAGGPGYPNPRDYLRPSRRCDPCEMTMNDELCFACGEVTRPLLDGEDSWK